MTNIGSLDQFIVEYEDTDSSDSLFTLASRVGLGKDPKKTYWYKTFRLIALSVHIRLIFTKINKFYRKRSSYGKKQSSLDG